MVKLGIKVTCGISAVLFAILLVLKIAGKIALSWAWVATFPLWGTFFIAGGIFIIAIIFGMIILSGANK